MEDVIMKVVQELVDYVSSGHQFEEKQIKSDWERDAHKFHNGILISDEPSEIKLDFFSLNYRKAPSISSAHSSNGNEQGDISDSELPFLVSDEDSDKEFERIQQFTLEARYNTFKREHPDGNPLHKVPKRETQLVSDDFYHDYDDLPPLDGLTIHCEDNIPMEPVGHVTSIVDCLVVIQSDNGVALDIDSVLFDKERNSIGVVYDLFGPVRNPLYSVRFNTKEEASKINVGMEVYFAPLAEQYTKTVIATAKK